LSDSNRGELSVDETSGSGELVVVVRDVCKEFHRDAITIPVLMGINLELPGGDYLALMGPSGSGKSTLLNLIAGLDRPTSGAVVVCGQNLGDMSEGELARWRSRHIGFIFQLYNLIPVLTAFENVELPLLLTPLSRRQRREHTEAALEVVGLSDRADHFPRQLSGGQEQRVAIARAIAADPTLLVADEPTGDLDARSAAEILDLLERLNREFHKTIVMVTHDPNAAERARRALHLHKGILVEAAQATEPAQGQPA
jgi:putative ABC transport system ATP-binding protein